MDAFLQVFGSLKVATIVLVIASLIFLLKIYKVIEKYFEKKYRMKSEQEKQFDIILKQVEQYPKWRQQSLDRQGEFTRAISALQESQKEITQELKQIEERRMKTERNKLRDR